MTKLSLTLYIHVLNSLCAFHLHYGRIVLKPFRVQAILRGPIRVKRVQPGSPEPRDSSRHTSIPYSHVFTFQKFRNYLQFKSKFGYFKLKNGILGSFKGI